MSESAPRVILASGSPRRRVLLGLLMDAFLVEAPDVDETPPPGDAVDGLEAVAMRKASKVAASHPDAVVIAADTAIIHGDDVLGKPADADEAAQMLDRLTGLDHRVVTAVAILSPRLRWSRCFTATVHMDPPRDREAYLRSRAWQGKAGGYGIQDEAAAFTRISDGLWSTVVGLPVEELTEPLRQAGAQCRDPPHLSSHQNPFD